MGFWLTLVIYVVGTVLYELLRPKAKIDSPDPAGIEDFKVPTIGEGRVIPLVWGTCKLTGPMVAWYGDLKVEPVTETVKTGWFSKETYTKFYRYYLGMQLVLCSGEIDAVVGIYFDEKEMNEKTTFGGYTYPYGYTKTVETHRTKYEIDHPPFFGGDDEEGGVVGTVYIYHGDATQDPHPYLETAIGEDLPAWRHICYASFDQVYLGTSPYIKNIALAVRRCPNQVGLQDGDENIEGDANPAAMIYELLIRPKGQNGMGVSSGAIDVDSFRSIGATLADEDVGLSMCADRSTPARDLIQEILRHVDGIMYVEPTTGLLTLTLVRFDYDPGTLPVLDQDNCELETFTRPSWGEVKNEVRVTYVNRAADFTDRTIQQQDLASLAVSGGEVNVQEFNMRGFSREGPAAQATSRAMVAVCYPLAPVVLKADRTVAWNFRPGTVFKWNWEPYSITGMVLRVLRITTGELTSGKVMLDCIEDIFGVTWTAYTPPGDSQWVDPAGVVGELEAQNAIAAPYEAMRGRETFAGVDYAVPMAAQGQDSVMLGYNVIVDGEPSRVGYFMPSGTLNAAITETSATVVVTHGPDTANLASINGPDYSHGINLAWIEGGGLEEFVAFQVVDQDESTVTLSVLARGCLDTAPTAFAADTRIWFISYGAAVVNIIASISNALTFQPYNNHGPLPLEDCDDSTVVSTLPRRFEKVYCPTDARFNGDSYPSSIIGELTVSWEHRNRLGEWSYAESGETSSPEDDTEYDVLVYGELGTLVHEEQGVTGKSWTYLIADEVAESGLGRLNFHLRIIIRTYGDSRAHQAIREIEWEFDRPFPSATATGIGTATAVGTVV